MGIEQNTRMSRLSKHGPLWGWKSLVFSIRRPFCGDTRGDSNQRKEPEMIEMILAQLIASFILWLLAGGPVCV